MNATTFATTRHPRNLVLLGVAIVAFTLLLTAFSRWQSPVDGTDGGPSSAALAIGMMAQTNGAIEFWEQRIVRDPQDVVAYNKVGGLYLRRVQQTGDISDYSRAQVAFESSIGVLQQNYDAHVQLAYVYNSKHEFAKALALAAPLVEQYPREPFGWGVLGDSQLALGRYEGAEQSYSRMLGLAPSLASFSRMAHVAELRGDLDGADLNWRNALSLERGEPPEVVAWAHVEYGRLQFNRGKLDAADDAFNASLAALPQNVHAFAGLASVHAARGRDDRAIALYQHVVDRNPVPEYAVALGDLYARQGETARANDQYALVRAMARLYEANGILADLTIIQFEADHGNAASAVAQAEATYRDRPAIAVADVLGWALYKDGRFGEARPKAEEALRLGTRDAPYLFHAGMIAAAQGDHPAARGYLGRALELNPRFHVRYAPIARQTLDQLARQP